MKNPEPSGLTHSEKEIVESMQLLEALVASPETSAAAARPVRVVLDTLRDYAAELLRLSQRRTGLDPVLASKLIDKLLERR